MLQVLAITAPIYLLMALGWLAVRRALFGKDELRVLGRFLLQFALPALLFRAVATRPIGEVLNPAYLGAFLLGSLAVFGAMFTVARRLRGKSVAEAAVLAAGTSCSNSGFIGYPIALGLVGPVAGVALALNLLVENIVMIPLLLALTDRRGGRAGWGAWRHALGGLLRNPMIGAIVAGLAASLLQLPVPAPLLRTIDLLAGTVAGIGLFVVGGTLVGLSTRGLVHDIASVAVAKLMLHPLAVWGALWLMPPLDPALRMAAVATAAAPMLGIYPILAQRVGLEGQAAAVLLGTTAASFFTLTAALALLSGGGLPWP